MIRNAMARMRNMVNVHRSGVRRKCKYYGSVKYNDPAAFTNDKKLC